ncbi:uncharacterized protein [Ptychodera flava]|uniref:uncharacterized protein n=1 Tax=Ptychodera flava TaxID=63121 RepID=UPI00396A170B
MIREQSEMKKMIGALRSTISKLNKRHIRDFKISKGTPEYNAIVPSLAKLYLTTPSRTVPRQKILDMLQDAVPDLTSTMAILQKLISFCKIKIGEWRQEEARKILCVEETKQNTRR